MLTRWMLAPLLLASACVCEPTVHVETAYASSAMADSIDLCAQERACTVLCARLFYLDPGEVDSCRILSLDGTGGAEVEVTYTTYTCAGEGWASDGDVGDGGDDWSDPGDPVEDDCSYGPCDDDEWYDDEDEWNDDDDNDDDYPEDEDDYDPPPDDR